MICESCGNPCGVGDWPFCPHGKRGSYTNIPDDVPGGFMAENGFSEPRRFDSHSEHRKALAAEGLEIRAKWAGPHDRHLTRWDSVDLEGAAQLVTRGVEARIAKRKTHFPRATEPIAVADGETFSA